MSFFMIRSLILIPKYLIAISKHISFIEVHTILKSGLAEIAPCLFFKTTVFIQGHLNYSLIIPSCGRKLLILKSSS